jgi:hypothetical protein
MHPTCTDETVSGDVLPRNNRLQQEAVLGVFGYPEIRHAWCDKVCRKLNKYWDAVASLLANDELLYSGERRIRCKFLQANKPISV